MDSFVSELTTLGIQEDQANKYVRLLAEQGLESIADCAFVTDEELAEYRVDNKEDRDKLKKESVIFETTRKLQNSLTDAGIHADHAQQYATALVEEGIKNVLDLRFVTDAELNEVGVKSWEDQAKIQAFVESDPPFRGGSGSLGGPSSAPVIPTGSSPSHN